MIVAILAGTADSVREDMRALDRMRAVIDAEVAAEIRLDLMDPPEARVFSGAPLPLIATCRRPRDGGRFRGSEAERLALLRHAALAGARWVDIEADVRTAWTPAGTADVIASLHDFEVTPSDLPATVLRLLAPGVAMVKVATRTRSLLDLMTLAAAVRQAPGRVFAVGLGASGGAARILADRLGSAWVNVRFSANGRADPRELIDSGVPELSEFLDLYRGGTLQRSAPAFAVVGAHADESIGPKVFNRVLRDARQTGTYVHLKTTSLAGLRETCKVLNIVGLSVTTPFKEAVLAAADQIETGAATIGAANTLVASEGGWIAANTDVEGIRVPVARRARERGRDLAGASALVVGAGGMGRAAAAALRGLGCSVSMASRGPDRLARASEALGAAKLTASEAGARRWDILVNATPAGSSRDPGGSAIDVAWANDGAVVVETNYRPLETPLVRAARERELDVITGDSVYAAQAAAQWGWFFPAGGDRSDAIREATSWAIASNASS